LLRLFVSEDLKMTDIQIPVERVAWPLATPGLEARAELGREQRQSELEKSHCS